ncbi:unnamed protein product [Miscanthus lutarioriparius]|uniref:MADS-box domain-containing protein n=1 Tax=Miscanthus lutarioriparius TaxID=422564 RepID=A0A811PSE6_9POAL|nr:unnamed protein product [Miscanthus lutarioriparius]
MARKKVTLHRIANDSTRRGTFKKRRKGLMKKASELATLCDVDTCVVVYGEGESQPEVWPDVPTAEHVLARFKAVPELDQCKKMLDMEGFLKQRMDKLREQLHKVQRDNREREATLLLHDAIVGRRPGLVGLSVEEIASLGCMVESRLKGIKDAIERLQRMGQEVPATVAAALQPQAPSSMPLMPAYSAGTTGHRDMTMQMQAPHPHAGWMVAGGDLGALVHGGGFGAGTSAGGDMMMPQFGNMAVGFAWSDPAGQYFHSM